MDTTHLFRSLGAGAHFNAKRYGEDINFFKRAVDGLRKDDTAAPNVVVSSLDFFKSERKNQQHKRKRDTPNQIDSDKQNGSGNKEGRQTKKLKQEEKTDKKQHKEKENQKEKEIEEEEEDEKEDEDGEEENVEAEEDKNRSSEEEEEKDDDDDEEEDGVSLFQSSKSKTQSADGSKAKKKPKKAKNPNQAEFEKVHALRNSNRIKISGDDIPKPITDWAQLNEEKVQVKKYLLRNIEEAGYSRPTPIQMQAVPTLLQGRELMAVAPTGSGKTASFLIPILAHLKSPAKVGFRAVIVSPTKELAQQIYRELKKLVKGKNFRVCVLTLANSNKNNLVGETSSKYDIMVTTPMRLVHLIRSEAIKLDNVQHLVLDEADRLFDLGFLEQIDEIINACDNKNVQRSLWSATMLPVVEDMARSFLRNPVQIVVGARNAAASTVAQKLVFVGQEEGKLLAMRQVIREGIRPPVLVFVQSKERAKQLFHELIYDNINVDVITSERTPIQRDTIIKNFRSGKIWVLIATDVMSRGMDFPAVSTVINYDLPQTTEDYIHRIGRTGRAGRKGTSITFYTEVDIAMLKSIANVMKNSGCEVPEWVLDLDKMDKDTRKELKKKPPVRNNIATVTKYDLRQSRKMRKDQIKRKKQRQQNYANSAKGGHS